MRTEHIRLALAIAVGSMALNATAISAQGTTVAKPSRYSVKETLVGTMLDDPAAAALLKMMIPGVYANDQFQTSGRALTLKDIQQYEPDALSDDVLATIQAALDKIPAKP